MRAKQSNTASGMYSRSGTLTPSIPIPILDDRAMHHAPTHHPSAHFGPPHQAPMPGENVAQGEGLLHDALNLMGAVGLYCDLLLTPGVLKPQHRRYAEELRLLGTRSGALMERLTLNSPQEMREASPRARHLPPKRPLGLDPPRPVSLRAIVEHCSGLLSRVAGGRPIEVSYGEAASMPVLIAEESVERILANLVCNSAAALENCAQHAGLSTRPADAATADAPKRRAGDAAGPVRQRDAGRTGRTADETPGAIRIGVGLLVNRVGESRPWPFQRVRLAVEDSGCGMTAERLDQVLSAAGTPWQRQPSQRQPSQRQPSRSNHGIGLRVVQELVAASHGELRIMSAPGVGTRIQIEWPIAALAEMQCAPDTRPSPTGGRLGGSPDTPARSSRGARPAPSTPDCQAAGRTASRRASLAAMHPRAAAAARTTNPGGGRWASC